MLCSFGEDGKGVVEVRTGGKPSGLYGFSGRPRKHPRTVPASLGLAWLTWLALVLRVYRQTKCGTSYASGTQATGKPPHGGARGCLHQSSPAAAGLLGS